MAVLGVLLLCVLGLNICYALIEVDVFNKKNYVYWPNATVPFYINPAHFDREQALSIMTSLSVFAFKTCLKFFPVMAEPQGAEHVLLFQNPEGVRRCRWSAEGHSIERPHKVNLGYQCLKSPQMEMTLMKTLGFPFEHNRASRDLFIDVQYENIDPDAIDLFTKDSKLPLELRNLPYDVNSAMHFGERDFSKNGHRTIIMKDHKVKQNRVGLSDTDLRKIEIVYGPECQKRDRQEKIDLCQIYPGVARKKREVDIEKNSNLRVNRDITPPPNKNLTDEVVNMLKDLGIVNEVESIVNSVYKTAAVAVEHAKNKYCNSSRNGLRSSDTVPRNLTTIAPSVQSIIEAIAKFSQSFVDIAIANLTIFCDTLDAVEAYQRVVCHPNIRDPRCSSYYRSTKTGPVIHYTQHRPVYQQSTKYNRQGTKDKYVRSGNSTENIKSVTEVISRRKREAHKESVEEEKAVNIVLANKLSTASSSVLKDKSTGDFKRFPSKQSLRSGTSVSVKKEHYAPFRRSDRRFRIYSRNDKSKDNRDDSSQSHERVKRKRRPRYSSEDSEDSDEEKQIQNTTPIKQNRYTMHTAASETGSSVRKLPQTVTLLKKNKEFYADRKWPDGVVRFVITDYDEYDLEDLRARIQQVNDILKNNTCVHVEELSENDAKRHNDYLVLDASPDYVTGRVGGRQVFGSVELFKGVSHKQHTAMMVMAWLGFYFEVSRHDRDDYVVVHNRHIRPDKLHHFEKIRSDATLALPYDYKSATHPSWQFWRKIGKKGISVVATNKDQDPDGSIMRSFGQNSQLLSDLDIIRINSIYGVQCFKKRIRYRNV